MEFWIVKKVGAAASGPYTSDQIRKFIAKKVWKTDWTVSKDGRSFVRFETFFSSQIAEEDRKIAEQKRQKEEAEAQRQAEALAKKKAEERKAKQWKEYEERKSVASAVNQPQRPVAAPPSTAKEHRVGTSSPLGKLDRLCLRITQFSGWILIGVGVLVLSITAFLVLNVVVITPLRNAAEESSAESRRAAANREIDKKMVAVSQMSAQERRNLSLEFNHPLYYYIRYYEDWVERKEMQNSSPDPDEGIAEENSTPDDQDFELFVDAGYIGSGVRPDLISTTGILATVGGSVVVLMLMGFSLPVILIAIGGYVASWSSLKLQAR